MPFRLRRIPPNHRASLPSGRAQWPSPSPPPVRPNIRHHLLRIFHTSPVRRTQETTPDHYETLQIPHTATTAEIKRQFFSLSKLHHPDKNPNDPTASTRFVQISDAYHVLSVPEKRTQYDQQLYAERERSAHGRHHHAHWHPTGSYSSAQSFAGGRAPTGLNKKRGTFRGPPPSFYKSGGYGKYESKRNEYAYQNAPGAQAGEAGSESYGGDGGYGPGQRKAGHEVPHFDDERHRRTQHTIHEHIHAGRRARAPPRPPDENWPRENVVINFLIVSGMLGFIVGSGYLWERRGRTNKKQADKSQ